MVDWNISNDVTVETVTEDSLDQRNNVLASAVVAAVVVAPETCGKQQKKLSTN